MYAQDNNSLPVWIILSPAYNHISTNSQPFLVGIVSDSQSHRSTPKLTSPINALFNEKTILSEDEDSESEQEQHILKQGSSPNPKPCLLSSLQPQLPTIQLSNIKTLQNKILSTIFSTLLLRLTSQQVQDLNCWMKHQGIPNVHEVIAQNFRQPHALEDNLKFITQGKTSYIQSNVMLSLSLMITYIRHRQYSTKSKYFGPF